MKSVSEHRLVWQDHVIEIIHTRQYCAQIGLDHLSILVSKGNCVNVSLVRKVDFFFQHIYPFQKQDVSRVLNYILIGTLDRNNHQREGFLAPVVVKLPRKMF